MSGFSSGVALMDAADRARAEQREADAALIEAFGCLCRQFDGDPGTWPSSFVGSTEHYLPCPIALAAKIREGK